MKQIHSEQSIKKTKNSGRSKKGDDLNLGKQWDLVQNMKKENSVLKEEIKTELRYVQQNDTQQNYMMEKIQEEGSKYAKKIEIETKRMQELQNEIDLIEMQMNEKKMQFTSSDSSEIPNLQKKMKTLGHQYDKIRNKHNESLAEIKRLKEEVNAARRERVIFDSVFKKLESDLQQKYEELKKYLFESVQIEKEKTMMKNELKRIQSQSQKELNSFNKEYKKTFLKSDMNLDNDQTYNYNQSKILKSIENENENTKKKNKKRGKNKSIMAQDSQLINDEIQKYEMIFEKIKIESNCDSIEEFIEKYQNQNEHDQKLFQESNALNDQIEKINKENVQLEQQVNKYKNTGNNVELNQKEVNDIKNKLRESKLKNEGINLQNEQINEEFSHLIKHIPEIIQVLGCEESSQMNKYSIENINISNIVGVLAEIEKKSSQLVLLQQSGSDQPQTSLNNVDLSKSHHRSDLEKSFETQKSINRSRNKQNNTVDEKNQINDLLEIADKQKETEKIMTPQDFAMISKKKIDQFKDLQQLKLSKQKLTSRQSQAQYSKK